jgi:DHA1 family bicyclomycin/chloramphenicol resistance-like MFS transporter
MVYLSATFFCFGPLFGNLNTLAVQPLGHIAGLATSIIASCQTLISVVIGGTIGYFYNESIVPLNIGFLACAIASFLMIIAARASNRMVEL